ncbi:hypothetical protein V1478_005069 [Vespula squamosa]|uniref:Uncharacterized protein n=1 Tax=Vespula squamosa TaxID=30214 RepID=A0ABD2BD38_VESSQ
MGRSCSYDPKEIPDCAEQLPQTYICSYQLFWLTNSTKMRQADQQSKIIYYGNTKLGFPRKTTETKSNLGKNQEG